MSKRTIKNIPKDAINVRNRIGSRMLLLPKVPKLNVPHQVFDWKVNGIDEKSDNDILKTKAE